jgi:hypothetical protein
MATSEVELGGTTRAETPTLRASDYNPLRPAVRQNP